METEIPIFPAKIKKVISWMKIIGVIFILIGIMPITPITEDILITEEILGAFTFPEINNKDPDEPVLFLTIGLLFIFSSVFLLKKKRWAFGFSIILLITSFLFVLINAFISLVGAFWMRFWSGEFYLITVPLFTFAIIIFIPFILLLSDCKNFFKIAE